MRVRLSTRSAARQRRHYRIRKAVYGTAERPRLSIYRSLRHLAVQIIDDERGHTIAAASTYEPSFRTKVTAGSTVRSMDVAAEIGKLIAERAKSEGITAVVFDRGGYRYHGYIQALADAARAAGLEF